MARPDPARAAAVGALLALGLAQMAADLAGARGVKAVAAATLLSPAPRVFSSARGYDTFAARFFVEWEDAAGAPRSLEVDRAAYARLRGPYNRRNVYGALFAYGPALAADPAGRRLVEELGRGALGGEAPLLQELGVDPAEVRGEVRLRCEARAGAPRPDLPWTFLRREPGGAP